MMDNEKKGNGTRRSPLPIVRASGPQEYRPGQQEEPFILTSLADLLQWAQNWPRSRSIWPLGYGLACCAYASGFC